MNSKLTILGITSVIAIAALASAQPVFAEGNARFNFAPQKWKMEGATDPTSSNRAAEPIHNVRSGSVPKGTSFLGIDPQMLSKPATPPTPQMQVAATPSFTTLQPAMPKSFNNAFGKPGGMTPPVIAHVPVVQPPVSVVQPSAPITAVSKALPAAKAASRPVVYHKPIAIAHHSTHATGDVHGHMLSQPKKSIPANDGLTANAGNGLDNYGKNFGYVPGPYLPTVQSGGMRTTADVSGRILPR